MIKRFIIFTSVIVTLISLTIGSASAIEHPSLIFNNITEVFGYQHRNEVPWSIWEAQITYLGNIGLTKNFSDPNWRMTDQSNYAKYLALSYQITKNTTYAEKAKEALLEMDNDKVVYNYDLAYGAFNYAFAYDWVQPYLNTTEDTIIRNKLAKLADRLYAELDYNGPSYIAFDDFHGRAYPALGVVGCVLYDYTNTSLNSTPHDWITVGTYDLFVNDTFHNYNKSLLELGFDSAGKHALGSYIMYEISILSAWLQVYNHFFGINPLDKYPLVKDIYTSVLWETLPNRYQNNYCTDGNVKYYYPKYVLNLLDSENLSYMLTYLDSLENSVTLPYSRSYFGEPWLLYLVYRDYSGVPRNNPKWVSHIDPDSFYQVIRGNWNVDSDWLSLIVWNYVFPSNRNMAHHDQLSFEYYSRGDLLVSDGGEVKHILDRPYGMREFGHNVLLIENPRKPFYKISSVGNTTARGIFKGIAGKLVTPSYLQTKLQTNWITLIEANATIKNVVGDSEMVSESLSSPIKYTRVILHPGNYFAVLDIAKSYETWVFRNLFRLDSLNITPSTGITEDQVGHVNGILYLNNSIYNWLSMPYNTEIDTGVNTGLIKWRTVNPYGKTVEMYLFSSPKSELLVTKYITRIAGYDLASEVFCPLVYFRTSESDHLNRISVLYTVYPDKEQPPSFGEITTDDYTIVHVKSGSYDDYIAAGSNIVHSLFSTDAEYAFIRTNSGALKEFFVRNATRFDYSTDRLVFSTEKIPHLAVNYSGNEIILEANFKGSYNITVWVENSNVVSVKRNGVSYNNWGIVDSNHIWLIFYCDSPTTYEILGSGAPSARDITSPTTTYTITPTPSEEGWINQTATITFFRSDDIGVAYTNYSFTQNGPWTKVEGDEPFSITVDKEGETTIWFYSVDVNGNVEDVKSLTVRINHSAFYGDVGSTEIEINPMMFGNILPSEDYYYLTSNGMGTIPEGENAQGIIPFLMVNGTQTIQISLGSNKLLPQNTEIYLDDDTIPDASDPTQVVIIGNNDNKAEIVGDSTITADKLYVFLKTGNAGDFKVDIVVTVG
ncbi:MAG: hypothetical protein H0Z28_09635 [Archaeoglobus sp.]|nr:hypothetical protein [Archaeoglobus sp.]